MEGDAKERRNRSESSNMRDVERLHKESGVDSSGASAQRSGPFLVWLNTIRITLSICLIYYHNNRLFDVYQHNLSIALLSSEEWAYTLIGSIQRLVLQAGLNMHAVSSMMLLMSAAFMMVSGVATFVSLRKRSISIRRVALERALKLVLVFVIAFVFIALPSNYVYRHCGGGKGGEGRGVLPLLDLSQFLSFASKADTWKEPGHLAFLPYLFILSILHLPYFVGLLEIHRARMAYISREDGAMNDGALRSYRIDPRVLAAYAAVLCVGLGWSYSMLLAAVVCVAIQVICCPLQTVTAELMRHLNAVLSSLFGKLHSRSRRRRMHAIVSYCFAAPVLMAFAASYVFPEFEICTAAIYLVYVAPLVLCTLPLSVCVPIRQRWQRVLRCRPQYELNLSAMALWACIVGQLLYVLYPYHISPVKDTNDKASAIIKALSLEAMSCKKVFGVLFMMLNHASFFVAGYVWMVVEEHLPPPSSFFPRGNLATILFLVVGMVHLGWTMPTSKGFFYVSAGYVSFHYRHKRFWYHLGGWYVMLGAVVLAKKRANEPINASTLEGRVTAFLSKATFGTFLIHPLPGYVIGCAVRHLDWPLEVKMIAVHGGVYFISYAAVWLLSHIKPARALINFK